MLDFPSNPTNGQIFTGPGGVQWFWDTEKWTGGFNSNAFAPIASPVFTGDPQVPQPQPGDSDASIATTAFVTNAVATSLHDVGRNCIHNSMMNIAQRGTAAVTVSGYTVDRWTAAIATDASSFQQNPASDTGRGQVGDEDFGWYLTNTFTGNAAAGAFTALSQRIENVRRLAGKTVTVSFWALCGAGALKLGINMNQYFGSGGSPSATVQVLATGNSVTLSTTWTRYTSTITLPSIAGKTLGTNNDHYSTLQLWYSSGANNNAIAGNIGVQGPGAIISIWGVQLELGPTATPLEKLDASLQLIQCQRFFQIGAVGCWAYGTAGASIGSVYTLPVTMRGTVFYALNTPTYSNCGSLVVQTWGSANGYQALAVVTATGVASYYCVFTASADL